MTKKETTINRDDYMDNKVDHQTFYCAVADAIGRSAIERIVLSVASREAVAEALKTDHNLNNIPLIKWDRMDSSVRDLVAHNAKEVMAVSWSDKSRHNLKPGTFCWSLSDTVCTLKAAARRLAEEENSK